MPINFPRHLSVKTEPCWSAFGLNGYASKSDRCSELVNMRLIIFNIRISRGNFMRCKSRENEQTASQSFITMHPRQCNIQLLKKSNKYRKALLQRTWSSLQFIDFIKSSSYERIGNSENKLSSQAAIRRGLDDHVGHSWLRLANVG